MAVNRLIIVASIQGVQNVVSRISGIGTAAAGAGRQASLLGKSLGTLAGLAIASQIAAYSDQFVNLQNKLKVVTTSTENLATVTDSLYKISINSRTAFEDTAKLYQRVALAGQQLGNSQEKNLRITDLLNKAIIVSGASTIEASNAMIQLSQGLAKGVLNGDELRSVLEQLPYVADLIAKHMKVTRGELRQLGADGKITSTIVQESILAAGESIDSLFAKMSPTIGQALTNVNSALVMMIGQINNATGAFTAIARAINFVAINLPTIASGFLAVGAAVAVAFGPTLAGLLGQMLRFTTTFVSARGVLMQMVVPLTSISGLLLAVRVAFTRAAAAAIAFSLSNPFTAILTGLTILLPLMYTYGDQIKVTTDGTVSLRDVLNDLWSAISQALTPAMQLLGESLTLIGSMFQLVAQVVTSALGVFTGYGDLIQGATSRTVSLGTIIYALSEGFIFMGRVLTAIVAVAFRGLAEVLYSLGVVTEGSINNVRAATDGLFNLSQAATEAQGRIIAFANGSTAASSASATSAAQSTSTASSYNNVAGAAKNAGAAVKEKVSYMLEEDFAYTKIAYGITTYQTALGTAGVAVSGSTAAHTALSSAIRVSADGINAITASEAYYEEQSKSSAKASSSLGSSVAQLGTQSLAPASEGMNSLASATSTTSSALATASSGASSLSEAVATSTNALRGQIEAMNQAAQAAANLATQYRAAAAAAVALSAAKASSASSGSQVQHNGGLVNSQAPIRYHTGGVVGTPMGPDEISAILQKGEEVITRSDPRHISNVDKQTAYQQAIAPGGKPPLVIHRNGLGSDAVTFLRPLSSILKNLQNLAQTTGQDQQLPEASAGVVGVRWRYGKGVTIQRDSYNPFDPFARELIGYDQARADGRYSPRKERLLHYQQVIQDSLKADWITKDKLNAVLKSQMEAGSGQHDYQTLRTFDQGYQAPPLTSWQPDLVSTAQSGRVNGDINVNVEMKVQDMQSFRQNKAQLDQAMYSAVERAKRRVQR